jgi:hypothetical protein
MVELLACVKAGSLAPLQKPSANNGAPQTPLRQAALPRESAGCGYLRRCKCLMPILRHGGGASGLGCQIDTK